MRIPVVMSWSGGKDSAIALQELLQTGDYNVVRLMTQRHGAGCLARACVAGAESG